MSWEDKTDYCGLAVEDVIIVKSATLNRSGQYIEKHNRLGAYVTDKEFGVRVAPSNAYTIAAPHTFSGLYLGLVDDVPLPEDSETTKPVALQSIRWTTGADAEPTLSATAAEVESGGATGSNFELPEFKISPDWIAQIPQFKFPAASGQTAQFKPAFTLSGSNCELTSVECEISCSVKTNDRNGAPKAHDVTNAHIVVKVTISQYGSAVPTLTAATDDGWKVSSPLTCDDPDSDMPTWTAKLSHKLPEKSLTAPSRGSSASLAAMAMPDPGDGEGENGESEER